MNNEQLKKEIAASIEKQIAIANNVMGESLFPDSFKIEIQNCFDNIFLEANELIEDFELEFEQVKEYLSNHTFTPDETDDLLNCLDWVEENDSGNSNNNDIVIQCDSLVQRSKLKNFLESEIFTDMLRYNAAVENL